jgi:para-nitrobenzyl esterase
MCVATLMGAPAARGLFQRAALQSGAARNVHTAEVAERVASAYLDELGVRRGDLEALRSRPVLDLLAAQARTAERLRRVLPDPVFQPTLDGALLPRAPLEALAEGAAADVPLLVGTNRDEWKFFGLSDPRARTLDEEGLLRRLRRGLEGTEDAERSGLAERVLEVYRTARAGRASLDPRELWFAIQTDRWFRHPAMQLAERQAQHQPVTHAYLFTWPSPLLQGALGACHALEVPFVFGTVDLPSLRPLVGEGAAVQRLSGLLQDAWLAFARGEVPSASDLPDWPGYDARRRATLLLGGHCLVVDGPGEVERSLWDEIS